MEKKEGRYSSGKFMAVVVAALGIGMLADSAAVSQGIRDGLSVCSSVLIPSLFPFMVLSGFISRTGCAGILSLPLMPVTKRIYKLPADMGAIVLLSLVGGYPVGAKMIATLAAAGRISKKTASRMLCFCVNCGPSFLVSAVGVGMLLNKTAGIILFATQTAATLLVGAAVSRKARLDCDTGTKWKQESGAAAFVGAVTGASSAMIAMCSFAVLFSGVLAFLRGTGVIPYLAGALQIDEAIVGAVISGFFEVTAGCISAARVGGAAGFALISVCVSFCGLSVLFQIISCFEGMGMKFGSFVLSRLAHAMLSTAMALPLYQLFCRDSIVWTAGCPPIFAANDKTFIFSICLLAMCSILVLSIEKNQE